MQQGARWFGVAVLAIAVAGCASVPATAPGEAIDPPRYVAPSGAQPPRVALVLSGGAARGFAHVGVLRVLEREGLRPDLVVGASAGAIVGALYASGLPATEIEAVSARLGWGTLIDFDPIRTVLLGAMPLGLARGERLEAFLREPLPAPMQSFPLRFAAVATDLANGEMVLLNHGDAPRALRASSAVPGLYEPVEVNGRRLVDGQVVSPLPVAAARRLGAQLVIAVDVVYPPEQSSVSNPISVLFQTMLISTWQHLLNERAQADLVVSPAIAPTSSQYGLGDREWLIKAGEAAAEKALPQLRAAMRAAH
jgi:NTE family protein